MKKKVIIIFLLTALTVTLFAACSQKKKEEATDGIVAGTYADYIDSGKVFAAQIGDIYGTVANDIFKVKEVQEFTIAPDMLEAVRLGKVDAAILDDAYVKQIQDSGQYPDLDYLPVPKEVFVNMASNVFHTEELRDKFNSWFEIVSEDGTFDEIYNRWIGVSLPDAADIPRFELTGENGTLKVCNTGNFPPFSYVDSNNQPVGFDEEILSRFAEHLGMDIEYNMMAYDAIIPYVLSGKADMSGCSFTRTDERADGVIFGSTYTKAKAVLVIKKSDAPFATRDYTSFAGKRVGAQTGEIYTAVARDIVKAGEVPEYPTTTDLLEALRMGKIDAVITDSSYMQPLIDSGSYPSFDYILIPKEVFTNKSAVVTHTEALRNDFNEWLAGVVADGTMAEMEQRWLGGSLPDAADIPRFDLSGENGTLRVCDTGDYPPFSYYDSKGEYTGMDYELISRFAEHMGMDIEVTTMAYDAVIPYVLTGKADMTACYVTVSQERGETVLFSDPIVTTQGVLIVPKTNGNVQAAAAVRDYTAFADEPIAVITGVLTVNTTEKIGGNPIEYNDSASAAEDVRKGRVAGYMHALTAVQVMASQMEGFEVIPVPKDIFAAQIGGISHDQAIINRFNTFLAAVEADGTLKEMENRWFSDKLNLDAPIPQIESSGANGILEVAVCSDSIPYVYSGSDGEYSGFSVELALRFGAYEGKTVKFSDMEFGGLIPYIVSKKADIALANMAITEERKQSVLFTEPFFDEQHGILTLSADSKPTAPSSRTYADFKGKDIAAIVGATHYMTIEKIGGNPIYYNDSAEAAEEVRRGTVEGFMTLLSNARVMASLLDGFEAIPIPKEIFLSQTAGISAKQADIDRFNAFLSVIKADGTLAEMENRWFGDELDLEAPMPELENSGENGTIHIATSALSLPYVYFGSDGELKGFSVELALRFGVHEGKKIEFAEMELSALIPYVLSEKADLSISSMAITEERKKSVLFTEPFHDEQHGILALKQETSANNISPLSYTDFAGKNIGMRTGSIWDVIVEEHIGGTPAFYTEMSAGIEDIRKGRLDGFMTDYSNGKLFVATEGSGELICVEVPEEIFTGPMGAVSMNQDIIERFNVFLSDIKADGTFDEVQSRWLDSVPDLESAMPDIPVENINGTLRVATNADALPFSYAGLNGEMKGYSVELARRFAAHEGMDIEFFEMEFGGMLPFVVSGKADFAIADISITEERKKSVLFTDSIYDDRGGIIAFKPSGAASTGAGDYTSLAGKNIGVLTGSFFDVITREGLNANPIYYQDDIVALEDVQNGRIDAVMYDYSTASVIHNQQGNEVFELIAIPHEIHSGPMGAISADQGVIDRFNEFLTVIESDGTLADMKRRWIEENPGSDPPMPDIKSTGENGTISVAITGLLLPFSYSGADNELKGFCVELALRFGAYEGKTVEFATMGFDGLIAYILSGKADIGIESIVITEERKQSVLFSEPYYYDQVGVMVLKQETGTKENKTSITEWLKTGIERNLITDNRWKMIVNGLGTTMTIAVLAQIFGTAFGCFICWLLMRKNRFVKWLGNLYCGLIYGTPIVVLLMITYYIIFGDTSISNVLVAVAAFTMITGASVAANLKGAIETVDTVEIEAARSIGFTAFKAFISVTFPQAVRRALPGYTNGFVELVKATAIVGYIAIQDLTRAGDIIRSRTYDAYFPLLFIAIIYLIVTTTCVQVFKAIVQRVNKGGAL